MRVYNLPINADLVEITGCTDQDWYEYTLLMHNVLNIEYIIRSTGGATQGGLINECKPAALREFL